MHRRDREREDDDPEGSHAGHRWSAREELVHTIGRARPKVWRGEHPTEPTPLVESLRRTPYRDPNQLELTGSDDQARTAIDLAVRVGELLLRCGAGARDVESGVIAVAAASGLDNLEVDITNQSLLVQGRTPAGTLMTMLRVVRSSSRDFARLVAVHRLVEDLAAGRVDLDEATARLRRIRRQKRPCPGGSSPWRTARWQPPSRCCSAPAPPRSCSGSCPRCLSTGWASAWVGWGSPPSTSPPSAGPSRRRSPGWSSCSDGGGRSA